MEVEMFKKIFRLAILLLLLSGCTSGTFLPEKISHKLFNSSSFTIQNFYSGDITAYGIVLNRDGKSTRQFKRTMQSMWRNGNGIMHEEIAYTDGVTLHRDWCMHMLDQNHFVGVVTDVDGVIQGTQYGEEIHMIYRPGTDIYSADKLHTVGEANALFRVSPGENLFSLLTAGSIYSQIKAVRAINRENIKPAMDRVTYTIADIGPVCQKVRETWHQKPSEKTILLNHVDLYAINKNVVIEKISIHKRNLEVGEVLASFERSAGH
jgi:hypothetical protein